MHDRYWHVNDGKNVLHDSYNLFFEKGLDSYHFLFLNFRFIQNLSGQILKTSYVDKKIFLAKICI